MDPESARVYLSYHQFRRDLRTTKEGRLPMKLVNRILVQWLYYDKCTITACTLVCRTWHEQIGDVSQWLKDNARPFPGDFPRDITIMILDQLSDDKATVKKCSLVCRDWEPYSRFLLFYTFQLNLPSHGRRLENKEGYAAFLDLLRHSPSIRYGIRRLHIGGPISKYYAATSIVPLTLSSILLHLPELRVLNMEGVRIASAGWYEKESIPADVRDIPNQLSPHLRDISLHRVSYDGEKLDRAGYILPLMKASHWSFHLAIAASAKANTLTTVSTTWTDKDWNSREELETFLAAIGPNLRHLNIRCPDFHVPKNISQAAFKQLVQRECPSLRTCTNLSSLSITWTHGFASRRYQWHLVYFMLRTLSTAIREVHIEPLSIPITPALRHVMHDIDRTVSQMCYLQYFVIHLRPHEGRAEGFEMVKKAWGSMFPQLQKAGKFSCVCQ